LTDLARPPLDAIARLAAHLAGAPMAAVSLVGRGQEHLAGVYALPEPFTAGFDVPLDHSVCKYVVAAGHPVRCADTLESELAGHRLTTGYGIRSFLGVPVCEGEDRPVGALLVLDTVARHWTDEQTGTLQEIAELLHLNTGFRGPGAVAMSLEVTAVRRAERFRVCHTEVERCLRVSGSVTAAAPGILEAVGTALGWPAAELWLIEESTGEPRWAGGWNAPGTDFSRILGQPVRKGFGVTGRVWQTGQSLWVPDISRSPFRLTPAEQRKVDACIGQGIRTVLGVPVRDGGTLLGVLNCFAGAPEDSEDLLTVLLDGVAAQVGVYVALRRAEELARQLARTQDDYIALVSHELRTPLTSIVANASLLAEDGEHLEEDHRAMLTAVVRNATMLSQVVDTLLDLAGLDSGHLALRPARIDLAALAGDAVEAARERAAGAGVRLSADRPARLWMDGDPLRLRQVLDDLVSNAVRYTPAGGAVRVRLSAGGGLVELGVTDTGIGTPAEERDLVFDRFYRGRNVRHQGTAGNGLGLSLARTIVQLHGGTIRLTGHRPRGTTVLVRLPLPVTG
jgi:signal transduction histidine kinase